MKTIEIKLFVAGIIAFLTLITVVIYNALTLGTNIIL